MKAVSWRIEGKGKESCTLGVVNGWVISKMGSQMGMEYSLIIMVIKPEEFGKMESYNESCFYIYLLTYFFENIWTKFIIKNNS